jgi:MerR family mercuric resistance operon transcriptional regulator
VIKSQHCNDYRVKVNRKIHKEDSVQIGQLAARTGILVETIRYYERVGLIPGAPRSTSGYRIYRAEHQRRLVFVRRCRDLGFSIQEIKSLIALADQREQPCATVTSIAKQHLADVRAKRADLDRLEQALNALIVSCDSERVADCKILEALARADA